jgi:hypothetical protein
VLLAKGGKRMETDRFEKAFSDFLDQDEYDEAQTALFSMVRSSFKAGWEAAGGETPRPDAGIRLLTARDNAKSK